MIGVLVVILLVAFGILAMLFDVGAWVIAATFGVPIFLWLLRRPAHMAGTAVALHAWPLITFGGAAGITPFKFAIVALAVVTIAKVYLEGPASLPWPLVGGLLFILVVKLVADLSAPFGAHFPSLYEYLGTLLLVLMLTQVIRNIDDLRSMTAPMVINLILLGMWTFYYAPPHIVYSQHVRVGGPMDNPNALAIAVLGPLPLVFAMMFDRATRRVVRLAATAAVTMGFYAMLASASRAGAGGTVLAFIVLGFVLGRSLRARVLMIAAVFVILPTAWYFSPVSMTHRITGTLLDEGEVQAGPQVGLSERDEHLAMAMAMIPESPWIGHGATGFVMRRTVLGMSRTWAHSSVLGVTVAYGVPVGLLYLFLLGGGIYVAYSTRRRQVGPGDVLLAGLLASLSGIVAASMMFSGQFRPRLWAFVAVAWILHHRLVMNSGGAEPQPEPDAPAVRPGLRLHSNGVRY